MQITDAAISLLVGDNGVTIEIRDNEACTTFVKTTLTHEQFCQALSPLMKVPCKAEVFGLHNVGKKQENKKFSFEISEGLEELRFRKSVDFKHLIDEAAIQALEKEGMGDWTPDNSYNSQDSFFSKDGKEFARVVIRRWVTPQNPPNE